MVIFTMLECCVGFARYLKESRNPEIMRRVPIESAAALLGCTANITSLGAAIGVSVEAPKWSSREK
jgi:hypothetical protein